MVRCNVNHVPKVRGTSILIPPAGNKELPGTHPNDFLLGFSATGTLNSTIQHWKLEHLRASGTMRRTVVGTKRHTQTYVKRHRVTLSLYSGKR